MNSCLIKAKPNTNFWWLNHIEASKNEGFVSIFTGF
jgi:hypothetical protein